MSTWSVPAFLDALKTALELRAGLSGVTVFTAHPGDNEQPLEGIVFHTVRGRQDGARMGPTNDERYSCEGYIVVIKPGAGHDVAKAARDRADAILNEIEAELTSNETVTATVGYAHMGAFDFIQGIDPNGRFARIEFDLDVLAIL